MRFSSFTTKGPSAARINSIESRTGALWMEDYHDRFIRDMDHFYNAKGAFVIRALCRDSLATRRLLETLRPLLYASAGLTPPALGRIFC